MYVLVNKVRIKQGTLHYLQNDENKYVDVSKDYKNYFNDIILEKVNNRHCGEKRYPTNNELYLALHRLLTVRRSWGLAF